MHIEDIPDISVIVRGNTEMVIGLVLLKVTCCEG